jgi:hypothetical protein
MKNSSIHRGRFAGGSDGFFYGVRNLTHLSLLMNIDALDEPVEPKLVE